MQATMVDELTRELARSIFLGQYAEGTNLPPIRELAKRHDTTIPTIQRVVAKLDELGLVAVRQGSGVRALNPQTHANQAALPYWLDALRDRPQQARALLADFLELRAVLALELLAKIRPKVGTQEFGAVVGAVDVLEEAVASEDEGRIVTADLGVVRAMLGLSPQVAFATVFNSFEALIRAIPEVRVALYAEPQTNVVGWRYLLEVLPEDDFVEQLKPLLRTVDEATLDRFVQALEGR